MAILGLDIGSKSIKLVQLEKRSPGIFSLMAAGVTNVPGNGLESDNERDIAAVSEAVKKLISDTKATVKTANIILPENKVFTRFIKLPYLTDQEVDSAIAWQAEPYIPIPLAEANIDYQVLRRVEPASGSPGSVEVLLVAAAKTLIAKYMKVAEQSDLTIANVETELLSLARALAPTNQTVVLADFGSSSTSVGVVRDGHLTLSYSIATGGEVLTRAVSTSLNLGAEQAEEYKRAYGLDAKQGGGKVAEALKAVFASIVDEIKKALQYYKTEIGDTNPISTLILAGGTAAMPQVVPYLAETLGMDVLIGDPFVKIAKDTPMDKSFVAYAPLYGVAIGAAENQ